MKSIMLVLLGLSLFTLTGCTKQSYTGNGEYTQLTKRNVIYRDLTRPISFDNDSTASKSDDFTSPQLIK